MDSQRIGEIATEANGQFSKDFSAAFKDAVVSKIKNAYLGGENKYELLQHDILSQDIKSGYLVKIGANVKNWKKRFFTAKNVSDNYTVVYYEDESKLKEKGSFCCCG